MVNLSEEEKRMSQGEHGPGMQRAISLLTRYGELFGSEKLVPVTGAHISVNIPTELLEEFTKEVEKARTACSLHAGFDPRDSEKILGRAIEEGEKIAGGAVTTDPDDYSRRMGIFDRLGFLPTFTCVPYTVGIIPSATDVFVWTGSSGQIASNSLFGARANREASTSALASAITGRTPDLGLIRKENRRAQVLVRLDNIDPGELSLAKCGAIGYYIGEAAGVRNVAIDGLFDRLTLEQCKYLTSPLPVSGACTMCHIVGVTPEAPTLEQALGGGKPEERITIGWKEIEDVYSRLTTAEQGQVDLIVFGCPHCTIREIGEIASLLEGKKIHEGVRLLIGTARPVYVLAERAGYADIIERAGGQFVECCVSAANPLVFLGNIAVVATNSARGAHYIQRMTAGRVKTFYADVDRCITVAVMGRLS